MILDHIGVAVKDIVKSIDYWNNVFGYRQVTNIVLNTRQKVLVTFLEKKDSLTIKLIQPSDESSTLNSFIKKRGGLHHLCFKTENLEKKMVELSAVGLQSLVSPQPGEAFDNNLIGFLFAKDNINIELIDTDVKASCIKDAFI